MSEKTLLHVHCQSLAEGLPVFELPLTVCASASEFLVHENAETNPEEPIS